MMAVARSVYKKTDWVAVVVMEKTSEQQIEVKKCLTRLPSPKMELKPRTEDCHTLRAQLQEAETEIR